MTQEILVLCPFGLDEGLLSQAVSLSDSDVRVLVPEGQQGRTVRFGPGRIHILHRADIADEADFARWLAKKIRSWGSRIVLAPATIPMRNIMPMLAWALKAGLTADCTALTMSGDDLIQTRPAFGNSLMASIRAMSEIQMATVRPGTFRAEEAAQGTVAIIPERYTPGCSG